MRTIAVHHLKGGVGKTTVAVNLAYLAAEDGFRTLLCDLDAQAAASFYLQADPGDVGAGKLVKGGSRLDKAVSETRYPNLALLPGGLAFRNLAVKLSEARKSRSQLRSTLRQFSDYDVVIIDASAGLDLEAESIYRASDLVLVPLVPSPLSVNALETVRAFVAGSSKAPEIRAFFSMVDSRRRLHREIVASLANEAGMIPVTIPNASEVEQMGAFRAPLVARRRRSRAANAFRELWRRVRREAGLELPIRVVERSS